MFSPLSGYPYYPLPADTFNREPTSIRRESTAVMDCGLVGIPQVFREFPRTEEPLLTLRVSKRSSEEPPINQSPRLRGVGGVGEAGLGVGPAADGDGGEMTAEGDR